MAPFANYNTLQIWHLVPNLKISCGCLRNEKRMLRKISGPERDEVTGEWRLRS
jgi:hypothetical protein